MYRCLSVRRTTSPSTASTVMKVPFCTLPPAPINRSPGQTLMVCGAFVGTAPHPLVEAPALRELVAPAPRQIVQIVQQLQLFADLRAKLSKTDEGNYVVTTDLGNELRGLEAALPGGPGGQGGPGGRRVGRHVDEAAEAHNARPHAAVTVAPEDVETIPAASFYQDNAAKFKHNDELTRSRQRRLEEAGAFRAPTNAARSFQPQYGHAKDMESYDSMTARATDGSETLLKHALPVPRGSAEPTARLTRRAEPLAARQLRDFNPGPTAPP
ncbi:unnamed protein product [Symbiodinium necroappetens]|uniref:Uncharacterized protein n=1 Tax=Symbiodinium necroappetens TaxID=1628268 RepID=A0A813BKT1_9DINO|nr:unnamed protein product [Symbiodinium necroappetens]